MLFSGEKTTLKEGDRIIFERTDHGVYVSITRRIFSSDFPVSVDNKHIISSLDKRNFFQVVDIIAAIHGMKAISLDKTKPDDDIQYFEIKTID